MHCEYHESTTTHARNYAQVPRSDACPQLCRRVSMAAPGRSSKKCCGVTWRRLQVEVYRARAGGQRRGGEQPLGVVQKHDGDPRRAELAEFRFQLSVAAEIELVPTLICVIEPKPRSAKHGTAKKGAGYCTT